MINLLLIAAVLAVVALQYWFGYMENKYLGAILPLLLIGVVIWAAVAGKLTFSIRDILMPLLGLLGLLSVWDRGKALAVQKRARELEISKARDLSR